MFISFQFVTPEIQSSKEHKYLNPDDISIELRAKRKSYIKSLNENLN
jgi:hypothetical protein